MKRILSLLAMLTAAMAAWADTATNVRYIDADGVEQICPEATIIEDYYGHHAWEPGWYVVQGSDVSFGRGVDCNGDVHLILADGAKLTIGTTGGETGIWVGEGNTLNIYGQVGGTGTLNVTGADYCAAIGGKAKAIIINGGTIQATGGQTAAAIGNSRKYYGVESIIINGGNVTANGGIYAAGIGSASDNACGTIRIAGGDVTATGGSGASGIGAGFEGGTGAISITGGNVIATGGADSNSLTPAGVGKGASGSCESLTVSANEKIFAGSAANPITMVSNDEGTDLLGILTQRYVKILYNSNYFSVIEIPKLVNIILGRSSAVSPRYELDDVSGFSVADLARMIDYLRNNRVVDPNSIPYNGSNAGSGTGKTPPTVAEGKKR